MVRKVVALSALFVTIVALSLLVYSRGFPLFVLNSAMDQAGAWLSNHPVIGPFVFVALYALLVVCFVPSASIALVGGAVFGPIAGTIYVICGDTAAAIIAFLLSRFFIQETARSWTDEGLARKIRSAIEQQGSRVVASLRLAPIIPYTIQNYLFGITQIRFRTYVAASALCMIPGAFVNAYVGHAGRVVLVGGLSMYELYAVVGSAVALVVFITMLPAFVRSITGGVDELATDTAEQDSMS